MLQVAIAALADWFWHLHHIARPALLGVRGCSTGNVHPVSQGRMPLTMLPTGARSAVLVPLLTNASPGLSAANASPLVRFAPHSKLRARCCMIANATDVSVV